MTTCGSYVIGHMALIVMSFIDEWALVKSCLFAYPGYLGTPVCSCNWIPSDFFSFSEIFLLSIELSG